MAACEKCGNPEILMGECQVCMKGEIAVMREALHRCRVLISTETEGGILCRMGSLRGRGVWYDCAAIERENIDKALTTCDQIEGRKL